MISKSDEMAAFGSKTPENLPLTEVARVRRIAAH
jgi:hypothetical protein